jgi:hypothetical protein
MISNHIKIESMHWIDEKMWYIGAVECIWVTDCDCWCDTWCMRERERVEYIDRDDVKQDKHRLDKVFMYHISVISITKSLYK